MQIRIFRKRIIGGVNNPLLIRYILVRIPCFGIYIHHLMRSDYDRALHDHPWPFMSFILAGEYIEHTPQEAKKYKRFSILFRPAMWLHRLQMDKPCWTLVIVGKRQRKWGFMLPNGWCWWRKHNADLGICEDEIIHEDGGD